MQFIKMNSADGKNYKQHINGNAIVKLALKQSYDINGKLCFYRNAKW